MTTTPQTAIATRPPSDIQSAEPTEPPQYGRGFDGMATEPFPAAVRAILSEQIDPHDVEIKPDGIVFLPGVAWRRILTRAFGAGGWAIQPRGPARVMGNIVIYHGALYCLGRFVAEAVGECFYRENNPNMSYASCVEGAKTDCLGRCAKDTGYGAEMWDANWREDWKTKYATSYEGNDGKKKWRLRSRVSNPHDLMVGAGGVAPATAAGVKTSPSSPGTTHVPEGQPDTSSASLAAPPSDSGDTGEAATDEQKTAIRAQLKVLEWKLGFMRNWFAAHFGVTADTGPRILEALTRQQADNVYLLLGAHGKPLYDALLADLIVKGLAR